MLPLNLPGQLVAVYDERMAIDAAMHGCSVIFIGDPVGMAQAQNIFISGAVFIPNVDAMQMLINGDKNGFCDLYNRQLYSEPIIHEFLDTIICALYQGKTVVFYVPEVAFGFAYHEILFQFICNMYGLHIQKDAKNPYYYEQGFVATIDALYNFKQIDNVLYLALIPDVKLEDMSFMKSRLCPMFRMEFDNNSISYLKSWKNSINYTNQPLRQFMYFKDGSK